MSMQELGWRDAILLVLRDSEEPLHYQEITRRIGELGLRELTGATPAQTVNKELNLSIQAELVQSTGRGWYALPSIAKRAQETSIAEETEAEAAVADPERLTVKAYGLYWSRTLVDWEPANGKLFGNAGAAPVDFADQDGIYLLHSGNEIVYVGQTFTANSRTGLYTRLRSHHSDHRKTDRWDTFSWFGFRPVDSQTLKLLSMPDTASAKDVINLLEAILIEGLMPRLNMRSGEDTKEWLKDNQYFQVEDPALIGKRWSALATVGQALR